MFPTSGSHIHRNEEGEVTGWDGPSSGELDGPDPDAFYEQMEKVDDGPVLRKVYVSYSIKNGEVHGSRLILEEGDTTEADIPRILAVKHYSDPKRAGDILVRVIQDIKEDTE